MSTHQVAEAKAKTPGITLAHIKPVVLINRLANTLVKRSLKHSVTLLDLEADALLHTVTDTLSEA